MAVVFFLFFVMGAAALSHRLSISDFAVSSDNPQYKYMGKGLSEMVAVELRKYPAIELIEREKRLELVEEMEFALSDLADSGRQLQLGKLLNASHLVFAEIIDMGKEILISLRMIDVQSGQVVWSEKLTERLSRYDYISGYFAESILTHLEVKVSKATANKAAQKEEKSEEAVVALSKAIDHYDKKEKEQAKKELNVARKLDPKSDATAHYLAKLVTNTAKFKVLLEPYFSYQNPAFLGIIRTDSLHVVGGPPTPVFPFSINRRQIEGLNMVSFATDKYISESSSSGFFGYAFPVGSRLGLRVDAINCGMMDRPWQGEYDSSRTSSRNSLGAILDAGYALTERWSCGTGLGIFARSTADMGPAGVFTDPDKAVVSGNLGLLYRRPDEGLIVDTRLGINNDTYDVIDTATLDIVKETMTPIFWETTLTLALNERRTFFIAKQINNICYDRVSYYATILPAVEHFLAPWISLRGGIEGSFAVLNDTSSFGYGALGGVTLRNNRRGFEFDLNVTYRLRPSREVEELLYPDLVFLINLTWNDRWVSRKEGSAAAGTAAEQ